ADTQGTAVRFYRLGELLPELGNGDRNAPLQAIEGDGGARAEAAALGAGTTESVAPERASYPTIAVDMVAALPVLPATGILINLQTVGPPSLQRLAILGCPADTRRFISRQAEFQSEVAEKFRPRVAQVPKAAAVSGATRVVDSKAQADQPGAGEEGQ